MKLEETLRLAGQVLDEDWAVIARLHRADGNRRTASDVRAKAPTVERLARLGLIRGESNGKMTFWWLTDKARELIAASPGMFG